MITRGDISRRIWIYQIIKRTTDSTDNNTYTELFRCYREGIVISFNARTTKIRLLEDNSVLSVSNRNISEISVLTNLVDIDIGLSYDEDVNKVEAVMKSICSKIETLDNVESSEYKGTQKFNDSSISYKIRFFCDQNYKCDLKRAVNRIIQDEFAKEGIKIPYNQLDIHNIDK